MIDLALARAAALAAYEDLEEGSGVDTALYPELEGFIVDRVLDPLGDAGQVAYVLRNRAEDAIVIAFRGLETEDAWLGNIDDFGWAQWAALKDEIIEYLGRFWDDGALTIAGHSLGGTLAQYAGYEIAGLWADKLDLLDVLTLNAPGAVDGIKSFLGSFDPGRIEGADFLNFFNPEDLFSRFGGDHVGETGATEDFEFAADGLDRAHSADGFTLERLEEFYDREPEYYNADDGLPDTLWEWVVLFYELGKELLKDIGEAIVDGVEYLYESIINLPETISSIVEDITESLSALSMQKVYDGFQDVVDGTVAAVNFVVDKLEPLFDAVVEAAQDMIDTIVTVVSDAVDAVVDVATSVWETVACWFGFCPEPDPVPAPPPPPTENIYDGTDQDDQIWGSAIKDIISAGDGHDQIIAKEGDDDVDGEGGDDLINGGAGADVLRGGDGKDIILGGAGDDQITGGRKNDVIDGGEGVDQVNFGSGLTGYELTRRHDGAIIVEHVLPNASEEDDGTDILVNVEELRFGNVVFAKQGNTAPTANDDTSSGDDSSARNLAVLNNDMDFSFNQLPFMVGRWLTVQSIDQGQLDGTLEIDQSLKSINFVPGDTIRALDEGDVFSSQFTYVASDIWGATQEATVTLRFVGDNDAPVVEGEEIPAIAGQTLLLPLLANDFDYEGHSLSITSLNVEGSVSRSIKIVDAEAGIVEYDSTGWFDFLRPGEIATDSFLYTVTDSAGASTAGRVELTIVGVNDAPAVLPDRATTDEDTAVEINVLANDEDRDGDPMQIVALNLNNSTSIGVTISADGRSIAYDPSGFFNALDAGETAIDTFAYTVSDDSGATSTASVDVTVLGVNDTPIAADDDAETDDNTVIDIDVLENDYDFEEQALRVTALDLNGSISHSVAIAPDGGSVRYDPTGWFDYLREGEVATDSFHYQVSDTADERDWAKANVVINGVNDAPSGVADSFTVHEDSARFIDVLRNDFDVDSDEVFISALDLNGSTSKSVSITEHGLGLIYDPTGWFDALAEGETSTDTFRYAISDGAGGLASVQVSMTIEGRNDAPTAIEDSLTTTEDDALSLDVLGNDYDVDGQEIYISEVGQSASGAKIEVAFDGLVINYDPNAAFDWLGEGETATDGFTYKVTDGMAETVGTVTVIITGQNDRPDIISSDTFELAEGEARVGVVEVHDPDDALADLTFEITGDADSHLFQIDDDGNLSFSVAPDFETPLDEGGDNIYNLSVRVFDGVDAVTQDISVTVTDVQNLGTDGIDRLEGTAADEIFESHAGRTDLNTGGGGADIFRFGSETSNNIREREIIYDFGADDKLDLGGAKILREINGPTTTLLQLSGDGDLVYLIGVADFDETTQLVGFGAG